MLNGANVKKDENALSGTPADEPGPCEPNMRSLERQRTSLGSAIVKKTKAYALCSASGL